MSPAHRAKYMWAKIEKHPGAMVAWYLMTSWLYYQHDISLLPDEDYNELCVKLLKDFSSISHRHKHLVDEESLIAGTGYSIVDYPSVTMSAAFSLSIEDKHFKWNKKRGRWEPRR